VGISSAAVAEAATGAGTHSKTTAKHPASCKASVVSTTYTNSFLLESLKIVQNAKTVASCMRE
jgi:hypothetical protein